MSPLVFITVAALGSAVAQPIVSFKPEFATPGKAFVLTVSTPPGTVPDDKLKDQRISLVPHGTTCADGSIAGIRPSSLALRQPVAAAPGEASWDVVIDAMRDNDFDNSYDVCYCAGFACKEYGHFVKLEQPGIITVFAESPSQPDSSLPAALSLDTTEKEAAAKELAQVKATVEKVQSDISTQVGALEDRIDFAKEAMKDSNTGQLIQVVSELKDGSSKLSALDVGGASLQREFKSAHAAEAAIYHGEMILQAREDHAVKRAKSVVARDQRFAKTLIAKNQRAATQLRNVKAADASISNNLDDVSASLTQLDTKLNQLKTTQNQLPTKTEVQQLEARVKALESHF